MPLFETITVDIEQLRETVSKIWGVEIDKCIKASQNHTYLAKDGDKQFILRITPDPKQDREAAMELEVQFLQYLVENGLPTCPPIQKLKGQSEKDTSSSLYIAKIDTLLLVVFSYADGEPVVYQDWKWLNTKEIVVALGRWFHQLHTLSKKYSATPSSSTATCLAAARNWRKLHGGVLETVIVDPLDQATVTDPNQFGIIHGDVNPSNYFWNADISMPVMFDWDQLQSSWFLYDLSAPIWGVVVLEKSGSDGKPVPGASVSQYTDWLLQGYEEQDGGVKVDRQALDRMVVIRRELYVRFCKQAIGELQDDHPMYKFCKSMVDLFESNKNI